MARKAFGKWAVRETSSGRQIRLTAIWVNEALAMEFEDIVAANQLGRSDVIRSAIQAFVNQYKEETNAGSSKRKDKILANRLLRVLLTCIGPREIFKEVVRLLPLKEVRRLVEASETNPKKKKVVKDV